MECVPQNCSALLLGNACTPDDADSRPRGAKVSWRVHDHTRKTAPPLTMDGQEEVLQLKSDDGEALVDLLVEGHSATTRLLLKRAARSRH